MRIYREKTAYGAVQRTVELVKKEKTDLDSPVYVFCESRTSLAYELALANASGGMFNVQVLSFARYVSLNANVENYLSRASATLIVRRIIEENSDKLVRLKKGSAALAESVYNLISGLKSAKVTTDKLREVVESEKGALKNKLADILFIYSEYEKFIKENAYTDESNFLTKMPALLRSDKAIRNSTVIISGISNLTRQIVDIILTLEALTNLTFVTVSYDAVGYTNEIYNKLLTLFNNVEVFDSPLLDDVHQAICDGLFNPMKMKKAPLYSDKIHIFEYADVEGEAEAVAKRIRYEVVTNGLRYKDFSIACENVEGLAPIYQKVFESYEIPLFADRKKALSMHPLVKLFTQIFQFRKQNFKPEIAIEIAKNPIAFTKQEADEFERYLFDNTPSRKMILKDFNNFIAESVRSSIIEAANSIPLKSTVNGYIAAFRQILKNLDVDKKLEAVEKKLSSMLEKDTENFSRQARKAFDAILSEAETLTSGLSCDIDFFTSLILSAVENTEISTVASFSDNVFFGDMVSAKQGKSKILFVVGLDNNVPSFKADTALLCDRDLIRLDGYKCIIEPKLKVVNKREIENILTTLLSFEDELYLSYSKSDLSGKGTEPSEIISYMKALFAAKIEAPEDKKKADIDGALEEKFYDFLSKKSGVKSYLLNREAFSQKRLMNLTLSKAFLVNLEQTNSELKDKLETVTTESTFDKALSYDGNISATLIENYFSCPYKAFGQNVLGLKELSNGDAAAFEIGQIFHKVFELFVKEMGKGLKKEEIASTAEQIFSQVVADKEYSRYLNKRKYEHIFDLMKKEVVNACSEIYADIETSDFKPTGTEVRFSDYKDKDGNDAPLPPIVIQTSKGPKKITGVIDRVDKYGAYVRIIDYKTGNAEEKASAKNLYSGNSIQLYLYMNALKNQKLKLAAAHYFMISDKYNESGDTNAFFGEALADKDLVLHFDKNIATQNSRYSIKITSKKEIDKRSHVLPEDTFNAFVDYAKQITISGTEEMYQGLFIPTPFGGEACTYCKLKGMCGYDLETGDKTRELPSISDNDIIDAMKENNNGVN